MDSKPVRPSCTNIGWGKNNSSAVVQQIFSKTFIDDHRPRFLQYNYMYDYRLNYYDDVIDYLDKKDRGITSEIPRPQTWAERVLRTVRE